MNLDPDIPAPVRIPFPLKRLLIRLAVWLLLVAGISYGGLVWWCAAEIAEPPRRSVGAIHQPFFDGTAKAGFSVDKFESTDGMPCLVCVPDDIGILSKKAGIIRKQLEARGIDLKHPGEIVGTVLILHGRRGIKEDYLPVAERFCAGGFRCLIPDLPGHGSNPEQFTTYGVLEAPMILKCYEEAAAKYGFPDEPCVIFGQSMGGSEAIYSAASQNSPFSAMVIAASFDKLETVIHGQTHMMLGSLLGATVAGSTEHLVGWKTGVRISEIKPMEAAAGVRIPTLVVHGEADRMIPLSAGKSLYDSIPEGVEKKFLVIPEAGHSDILITDYPLYATIAEWFLRNLNALPGG